MKLTCKYTAIEFSCEHFGGLVLRSQTEVSHPIFSIPRKQLYSRISDFHIRMNPTEQKLCYIALLASTGLVSFRCAAKPTDATIQSTFNRLVKMAAWIDTIQHPAAQFPSYIVSAANADLGNIGSSWLTSLEKLYTDWLKAEMSPRLYGEAKDAKLRHLRREAALDRLVRRTDKEITKYGGMLAQWIITVCKIPEVEMIHCELSEEPMNMRDFIRKVFTTSDEDILKFPKDDIGYLYEYLIEKMPQESISTRAGWKALDRLKEIVKKQGKVIGMLMEDYKIITEEDELQAITALEAPIAKPDPGKFSSRVDYLLAKAKYQQQQALLGKIEENKSGVQI